MREITMPHRADAVGRCIYCGSYDNLTDEHILAFALGGNAVLPRSSCVMCARLTGRDEAKVLRGGFWAVRDFLGYQTRTRVRPSRFVLHSVNGQEDARLSIESADYPVLLALPTYAGPLITSLPDCPRLAGVPWHQFLKLDPALLLSKYAAREYAPTSVNLHAFARLLMKTAHSLAVMTYGLGSFDAFLPRYILGEKPDFLLFVGSSREQETQFTDQDNVMRCADFGETPKRWIVAHLNLFARFGAPGYRIIVGQHFGFPPPDFNVPQPPLDSIPYASEMRMMISFSDEKVSITQ